MQMYTLHIRDSSLAPLVQGNQGQCQKGDSGGHQKGSKPPTKEQKEISAISSKVKSDSPHPRGQVKVLCTKGEVIL